MQLPIHKAENMVDWWGKGFNEGMGAVVAK